nr:SDR family NAD(P)-dependent oxidoreductase [uncultured Tolumonas sp.]
MNLNNNTILITGGTSGIGYALAKQLITYGNTVIITGRSPERLAAASHSLPGVHSFVCDQRRPESILKMCQAVIHAFPKLNVLINNAGIGHKRNLHDAASSIEELEELGIEIHTNLIGPIQIISQLLPQLKSQPSAMIVNVTSGLAFVPMPLKPIYCATKAGMHSYTQSLRIQLKHSSVQVLELAPPATDTDFNKGQEDMNTSMLMSVDKLATAAIRGMEKGETEVLPGFSRLIRVLGRINPTLVIRGKDAEKMG